MNWKIIAIGKPKLGYVQIGAEEYLKRLQGYAKAECLYLKDGKSQWEKSVGSLRIVLDERGKQWSSQELAQQVVNWEQRSVKSVAVLIGGADGHADSFRQGADLVWSLSNLTLPHEMALVVVLEQIYRAYTIKAGLPYHRA